MSITSLFFPRASSVLKTAAAVIFFAAASAQAAVVYETDFSGAAGAFPGSTYSGWSIKRSDTATPTTTSLSGDGVLQMTNPAGATSSQFTTAYYTGAGSSVSNGKVTSVVQFISNNNQSMGVMARIQNPSDDGRLPVGYFAGILRDSSGIRLVISKNIQFTDVGSYIISASSLISISSTNYYRLEFAFEGASLTASLYSNSNGTLITSINTTDSSYSSGITGLRTNFRSDNRVVGYESFKLEAIPEPATAALLVPAAVAGFLLRRKLQ